MKQRYVRAIGPEGLNMSVEVTDYHDEFCHGGPSLLEWVVDLLTEWYGEMLVRFRYFAIRPDSFLWRADATFDRGKTWVRDFWTMQAKRVAR